MRTNDFDPIAYIESGFLDTRNGKEGSTKTELELSLPSLADYIGLREPELEEGQEESPIQERSSGEAGSEGHRERFRKTVMSAPRPRRAKQNSVKSSIDPDLHDTWLALPKNVAFLCGFFDDAVTKNYYRGEFKESRQELIRRLLDPELSLEETARLLGVCPATVRRYTNRGWLAHHRTTGGQRRFRLSSVVKFVDQHGRLPEE